MRADRLLSMLSLLQARGRMTAAALSRELEVSARTVYRDMEALSAAGVPIYAERGPGGGLALLDSYRTQLTGLKREEAQALFMLSIPAPLAQLGVSQDLKGALLKLSAALPEASRGEEARSRQRIHLDSTWWFQPEEAVPHLQTIHQAVWEDRLLRLVFSFDELGAGRPETEVTVAREVAPYGLVAKASVWYLVWAREGAVRATRVSQLRGAELMAGHFERPAAFDLAVFWQGWCATHEGNRPSYPVRARVAPVLLPLLRQVYGREEVDQMLAEGGMPDGEGWRPVTLRFETLGAARERILSWGRAIEVLAPKALRLSLVDLAQQIVHLNADRELRVSSGEG